jgi:hypothetical protein
MSKKFIVALIAVCLLVIGCTGGESITASNDEIDTNLFDVYQTNDFAIGYPKGWKLKDDFTSDLTQATEVAFISHVKEFFFTPTVSVSMREVTAGVKTLDFAKVVMAQNEKSLLNFNLVESVDFALPNVDASVLHTFQGKVQAEGDLVEYFQTYAIFGSKAFIITGAHDPNGDPLLAERLLETLQNFRVR